MDGGSEGIRFSLRCPCRPKKLRYPRIVRLSESTKVSDRYIMKTEPERKKGSPKDVKKKLAKLAGNLVRNGDYSLDDNYLKGRNLIERTS